MRFLNRKWAEGGYDDFTSELYWSVYVRHLEDIASDLPKMARAVGQLSLGKGFAGCEIAATSLDPQQGSFKLILRVQTIEGDAFLELNYAGVDVEAIDPKLIDEADFVLTDELDLAPDESFEHRFLLSPKGELSVRFKDMELHLGRPGEDE